MSGLDSARRLGVFLVVTVVLSACSMAKIESRLEANPQCKEVVNPKTGATMPCPGPELLAHSHASNSTPAASATGQTSPTPIVPRAQPAPPCKPQMNTKTGSIMPCQNG